MTMIDNLNWRYFLALEEELIATQGFVEPHEKNYGTFSLKYRAIILQACSEIEILFKKICSIEPEKRADIKIYRTYINKHHKHFFTIEVLIPLYHKKLKPWFICVEEDDKSPLFWNAYKEIKHEGKLESATLKNAIDSLAGLFSLLLAWYFKLYKKEFLENEAISLPKLFNFEGLHPGYLKLESSHNIKVPGFEETEEQRELKSHA